MKKTVLIFAIVLAFVASVSGADPWHDSPFKRDVEKRSDGVVDYNEYIGTLAVNAVSKLTIQGCPTKIVKKFHNGGAIDTLILTKCPQGSAIWMVTAQDSLDGSAAVSDVCTTETNGDTLFVKRQSAAGALGAYCLIRIN